MSNLGVTATQDLLQAAKGQASIDAIKKSANALKLDKSMQAAKDFEAVFVSEMIKPMFEMIEVDETFGGGKGEEVFRGMLVQEYGKIISNQGGIGIADDIQAELLKQQEHSQHITTGDDS
ncbi:MAG: rod-binding protein [Alphaproteobacteria bacterium]|jgi:flagellar protein FlgJ|nr:rod-binding protein [Alphaproteobacteria bacterium]MCB1550773.1 rod-binding protein [Alphaproteobacteria bacterium]MCB9984386.1 rod-binding protein [Micavibrio sp.]HPQ50188.1 rod-binding protein [Alphaproteobacteria bacterium]HRK97848.1 rod-binding protein [Alphaproteobacteria bacterium]